MYSGACGIRHASYKSIHEEAKLTTSEKLGGFIAVSEIFMKMLMHIEVISFQAV